MKRQPTELPNWLHTWIMNHDILHTSPFHCSGVHTPHAECNAHVLLSMCHLARSLSGGCVSKPQTRACPSPICSSPCARCQPGAQAHVCKHVAASLSRLTKRCACLLDFSVKADLEVKALRTSALALQNLCGVRPAQPLQKFYPF